MSILVHEKTNLIVGDQGPDNNMELILDSVKLPDLEEETQGHNAGGAIGAIEIGNLGLKALSLTFKIKGHAPANLSKFGLGRTGIIPYTIYGTVRDSMTGLLQQMKCIVHGRMVRVASDELRRSEHIGHDFGIAQIIRYQLHYDGKEKYWYDWHESDWRVDGVSPIAQENAMLGIG